MLDSEILNAYYQMSEDPDNISFASIMVSMSDTLDWETIQSVKLAFDDYIKSVEYTKYSRKLLLSAYKAIIDYQLIYFKKWYIEDAWTCYEIFDKDGQVEKVEARAIYESVFELILSRSNDHYFFAEFIRLLEKILIATINNSPLPETHRLKTAGSFSEIR